MEKRNLIRHYFQSWLDQNREAYDEIFDEDVFYSECYGPEYHGLTQVKQWFDDWNQTGKVLEWTIHNMIIQDSLVVVERNLSPGQSIAAPMGEISI